MNLLRRHLHRRVLANLRRVEALAAGQFARPQGGPCARRVLGLEKRLQAPERGNHVLADDAARRGDELGPLATGDRLGQVQERCVKRAVLDVVDELRADRLVTAVQHDPRLRHADLEAGPHQGDVLVHHRRQFVQAGQVVAVVLGVVEAGLARQAGPGHVEAPVAVERDQIGSGFVVGKEIVDLPFEYPVVDAFVSFQAVTGDTVQLGPDTLPECMAARLVRLRDAAHAAGIAAVSGIRGEQGKFLHPEVPFFLVDLPEPFAVLRRPCRQRHADQQDRQRLLRFHHFLLRPPKGRHGQFIGSGIRSATDLAGLR